VFYFFAHQDGFCVYCCHVLSTWSVLNGLCFQFSVIIILCPREGYAKPDCGSLYIIVFVEFVVCETCSQRSPLLLGDIYCKFSCGLVSHLMSLDVILSLFVN